jgi:hypothetical protein
MPSLPAAQADAAAAVRAYKSFSGVEHAFHCRRAPHGQAFPDQHRHDAFSFAKNAVSIAAEGRPS